MKDNFGFYYYDISKFEELVEQKYIRKSETDDLVLYTYTEQTTYEKYWNDYTRAARGLILDKHTGELVAKPFPKFFNLGEMPEVYLTNLPSLEYTVSEKVDGSLGIIYFYNNKWNVATKGSFASEQSIKAEEILKKYDLTKINTKTTLLVEIIYPENRVVVDYNNEEKLVLIGAYNNVTGNEFIDLDVYSNLTGLPLRKTYSYTINEMIKLQKTIPKNQEGFVIRFSSGLRIKIKGEEYLKIHKIISNLSPLSFWEVMENGKVPINYIQQVPEEFLDQFEPIVIELEKRYIQIKKEVEEEFHTLPNKESRKEVGLHLKKFTYNHESAMFPMLLDKKDVVDKYIMKQIRPKGNSFNL